LSFVQSGNSRTRQSFDPSEWTRFYYVDRRFLFDEQGCEAELRYAIAHQSGEEQIDFVERYRWHGLGPRQEMSPERLAVAERLLTHLWLVAGLSYYKTTAAPSIVVLPPEVVTSADVALHSLLLTRGLGEFCFVNGLPAELHPQWAYEAAAEAEPIVGLQLASGPLVPVGGGKDSCVTIESLRLAGRNPTLVTVRRFPIIQDVIDDSGLADVRVDRTLDPRISELNAAGALNGHVPATAIVSFAALIAALLGGHDALVMSNERSASEGNVEYQGVSINHQWAKSDEAEAAIAAALARITPELRWFSLLRPLSELEISRRFAQTCERYFGSFSSCNRTQRIDPTRRVTRWCGECPKCQFVYLALATALPRQTVETIWGDDLFASSPMEGFRSLLGLTEWKPFECVGEHLECQVALAALVSHPDWSSHPVLQQLAHEVRATGTWPTDAERGEVFGSQPAPLVPQDYEDVLGLSSPESARP
jgi:UDP-N-acetyl-alpha-D-muramoyl-L-alanyl-L-glutamate epimerase